MLRHSFLPLLFMSWPMAMGSKQTEVEKYLKASGILNKHSNLIKLDILDEDADDSRIIQGIKRLIS